MTNSDVRSGCQTLPYIQSVPAKHPKISVAISVVEFVFIAILLGSIDVGVGLVVATCVVLVRAIVIGRIHGFQQWWSRALLWSSVIVCYFILIVAGLTIRFQMLGAKVFSQFTNMSEIVMIGVLLTCGLAVTDALSFVVFKMIEWRQRSRMNHTKTVS